MLPQYTKTATTRSGWTNQANQNVPTSSSPPAHTILTMPSSSMFEGSQSGSYAGNYAGGYLGGLGQSAQNYAGNYAGSQSGVSAMNFMNLTRRKVWKRYQGVLRTYGVTRIRIFLLIGVVLFFFIGVFFMSSLLDAPTSDVKPIYLESPTEALPSVPPANAGEIQTTPPRSGKKPGSNPRLEVVGKPDPVRDSSRGSRPGAEILNKSTVLKVPPKIHVPEPEPVEEEVLVDPVPPTMTPPVKDDEIFPASASEEVLQSRRNAIKGAFLHAWRGYEKYAFGHDEIRPCTNETNDSWNGWGVTLVDGLDTMYLMDLREEFERSRDFVATLNFQKDYSVSFFETTIRYLGGLLSAFTLSEEQVFLTKAVELADALLPAFDTPTGIAMHGVNVLTGKTNNPGYTRESSILAETGTVQLEFKYLSYLTGNPIYAEKAQKSMDVLDAAEKQRKGLYPLYISPKTGKFTTSQISFGALADSFYEYLLKQFLQTRKAEDQFKRMYIESVEGMRENLIEEIGSVTFLGEMNGNQKVPEADHLLCFVPGMLALGAIELERPEDMELAKKLADTCYMLYADQESGIGPEKVRFENSVDPATGKPKYRIISTAYYLRPETLESIFILHRTTGDPKYREWGWNIFQSIEKYCKTESAYTGLRDVTVNPPTVNNSMPSFFLAETLKYLFLLFSEDSVLPLSDFVFNTEAHPLRVFTKP